MKLYELTVTISTKENWGDSRMDSVCEAIESALDDGNLKVYIENRLRGIPERDKLEIEIES
jgi:hypothetical protein